MTRHQRGYVFKSHNAFHVRYVSTAVIDGESKRVQRSERLCEAALGRNHAKKVAADVMRRINGSNGNGSGDTLLSKFFTQVYIEHVTKILKPSTVHGYKTLWKQLLEPAVGGLKLYEYKTADATRFLTSLSERDYGVKTIHHVRAILTNVFEHALSTGLIDVNPVRGAKCLIPPKKSETTAYTLEQCENIVTALLGDTQAQLVFCLAAFLGLRPGEIAGLQHGDVTEDADGVWINVRRSAWRGLVGATKTEESVASLLLIEPVKTLLREWQRQSSQASVNVWMFPSSRGGKFLEKPCDISGYSKRVIAPALKQKNITYYRGLYSGRRGAATVLTQLTGNALAAQVVLRHSNLATTTAHYVKPVRDAAVAGLKLLEAKLEERKNNGENGGGQ